MRVNKKQMLDQIDNGQTSDNSTTTIVSRKLCNNERARQQANVSICKQERPKSRQNDRNFMQMPTNLNFRAFWRQKLTTSPIVESAGPLALRSEPPKDETDKHILHIQWHRRLSMTVGKNCICDLPLQS
jgi:hypothetical protein